MSGAGTRRVWIVDDDAGLREAFTVILHDEGFTSAAFASGAELVAALGQEQPDIIFIDLSLQQGSGEVLVRQLKGHEVWRRIPVVVMSGAADLSQVASELPVDDYLEKPSGVHELLAKINHFAPLEPVA